MDAGIDTGYRWNRIVQAGVVRGLSHRGVVVDLGDTRCFDPAQLAVSVEELVNSSIMRERMTNLGRTFIDGLGTTRVVQAAQELEV